MEKFNLAMDAEIAFDLTAGAITVGELFSDLGDMAWNSTFCSYNGNPPPYSWISYVEVYNDTMLLVQAPHLKGDESKAKVVSEIKEKIMKKGRLDKTSTMKLVHVRLIDVMYRPVIGIRSLSNSYNEDLPSCCFMLGESMGDLGYFE